MAEKCPSPKEDETERKSFRKLCSHYSRACSLVAPCCDRVYSCRICHDEEETHQIDRFAIKEIVCRKCNRRQQLTNNCCECSITFARYFCSICHLYDDAEKGQYHCTGCGICRIGGRDNFFHCNTCGLCLAMSVKDTHKCIREASRSNCPVCMEDLHTSRHAAHVPKCGHLLHSICFQEMLQKGLYQCPQCQTSLTDMTSAWQKLDQERQQWMLPVELRDFLVKVQCRDCREENDTNFHFVGFKCPTCGSYNTVRTGNESLPLDDVDPTNFLTNPHILDSNDEEDIDGEEITVEGGIDLPIPTSSTDSDEYQSISSPSLLIAHSPGSTSPLPHVIDPSSIISQLHIHHDFDDDDDYIIDHLIGTFPEQLNFHNDPSDDDDWVDESDDDVPFMHFPMMGAEVVLNNPFYFFHHMADNGSNHSLSDSPQIWEVTEDDEDEGANPLSHNGQQEQNNEWETSSEEEIVGGNEEDLGKVILVSSAEDINQLGDVAPAH